MSECMLVLNKILGCMASNTWRRKQWLAESLEAHKKPDWIAGFLLQQQVHLSSMALSEVSHEEPADN